MLVTKNRKKENINYNYITITINYILKYHLNILLL